jgi:hypothetical protein
MHASRVITGHNLLQPAAIDAPLDMTFSASDAELLARCASAVDAIKAKHTARSVESELEAIGIQFVGGGK